ncbi:MAG: hypothetical protein WCT46_04740 [Candidatus Gracilibacteria bacterium]
MPLILCDLSPTFRHIDDDDTDDTDDESGSEDVDESDFKYAYREIRRELKGVGSPDAFQDSLMIVSGHDGSLMMPDFDCGSRRLYGCFSDFHGSWHGISRRNAGSFFKCFREKLGAGIREGSFGVDGDTLSVTPSIRRCVSPKPEDMVFGLMVGQEMAEYVPYYAMRDELIIGRVLPHLCGKKYANPFEFAYDCIRYIKGYAMAALGSDHRLISFDWIEGVVKDLARLVGNCAPKRLNNPKKYDLANVKRKVFYDKIVDVFGDSGENAEIVMFLMENFRSFGNLEIFDDAELVELLRKIPDWVKNGFVIDRASGLCRSIALKASLRICDNVYGVADRPWWFKEDEDLVRFFDLESQNVSVRDGKLQIGVCEEGFGLVEKISEVSGPYFVHACDLYKEAGYRVVDAGLSCEDAISITSDIAKWYGVYNVPRGARVVEHLLAVLSQSGSKEEVVSVFRRHLERYKPSSPFMGKMEGDATLQMPGLQLLLGVAKGEVVNEGEEGKDEFNLAPSDLGVVHDFLQIPLAERAAVRNPLLPCQYEDRRHQMLLTGATPLMIEDHSPQGDGMNGGVYVQYMSFDQQLRDEVNDYRGREVSAVYFNLFAQKMRDPLAPPKGLLKALSKLASINIPMKMTSGWRGFTGFVSDDESGLEGFSNEVLRYFGLVSLFDARNMGLVTDEQVSTVLDMIAVERPGHDEDWAEVKKLKDEEKLQRSYLGLPERDRSLVYDVDQVDYKAGESLDEVSKEEIGLLGVSGDMKRLWESPDDELNRIISDSSWKWEYRKLAKEVLEMRTEGYSLDDLFYRFSGGELAFIRDTRHSCVDERRSKKELYVDDDFAGWSRSQATRVLDLRSRHQKAVNRVCRLRAQGFRSVEGATVYKPDYGGIDKEATARNLSMVGRASGAGEGAARWYVEYTWGKGKIATLHQSAEEKDKAHIHRLYDVTGPLSDVGIALSDAMNLVKMGVLTVSDLQVFARAQLESLMEIGSVRYQPVTPEECDKRGRIGDEARNYNFKQPIDPKKVDAMIARGVLNIGAFRETIRDFKDVAKTTSILLSVVKLEALYVEALESADEALASVSGMLDRSCVTFSPIAARDSFLDGIRSAREKFMKGVQECQDKVEALDPDIAKFLNFSILGDQLARFEEAVIRWFSKMVPKDSDAGMVAPAVVMLYSSSSGGASKRSIGSLDSARYGVSSRHEGGRFEEMRQLSDDMLDITSRLLAYIWMTDPNTGGDLVRNVQRVLELEANAGAGSTALAIRDQVGGLSLLGANSARALDLLLPQAREAIINARRRSAYLVTTGGKVHTMTPMDPRYFELIKSVLGLSNSPFRLVHGHSDKTLVLPPTSSSLEMSLLLNGLVLFGVIPLRVADIRQGDGREDSLPDAQICLPTGRLNAENCAFLGSCVLLATNDGVQRYSLEAFMSNNSGAETGARMMIYDGGAANLPLPFIYGQNNGRVDMLGRRSVLDIDNLQLLGTVLSHSQFGGPFGKFADPFKRRFYKILQKYKLTHVVEGSFVHDRRASYTKKEQIDHLKCVNDCCGAWSRHRFLINSAVERGVEPPDGIIYEVNRLLNGLREAVEVEVRVLHGKGEFRDELDILLAGQELYLRAA